MSAGIQTVIFPVKDLDGAKHVFIALLGAEPVMDEPYYVQFNVDGLEVGLDPNGHAQGMTGPVAYWRVDDIDKALSQLTDAGATVQRAVRDVGGGRRIATLVDVDGNAIGVLQVS